MAAALCSSRWRGERSGKAQAWQRAREWGGWWPGAETVRHPLGSASERTLQSCVPRGRAQAVSPGLGQLG